MNGLGKKLMHAAHLHHDIQTIPMMSAHKGLAELLCLKLNFFFSNFALSKALKLTSVLPSCSH
jgi:hypothetical protein